jgi:hypothetical protein
MIASVEAGRWGETEGVFLLILVIGRAAGEEPANLVRGFLNP